MSGGGRRRWRAKGGTKPEQDPEQVAPGDAGRRHVAACVRSGSPSAQAAAAQKKVRKASPTIGPSAGPAKGAREKKASAMPRRSESKMSEMSPPALVSGQAANAPDTERADGRTRPSESATQVQEGERGERSRRGKVRSKRTEAEDHDAGRVFRERAADLEHPVDEERDEKRDAPAVDLGQGRPDERSEAVAWRRRRVARAHAVSEIVQARKQAGAGTHLRQRWRSGASRPRGPCQNTSSCQG